jgi:hypothetical protein
MNENEEKKQAQNSENPAQPIPPPQVPGGIPQDVLALHQMYVEQMMHFMNQWQWYVYSIYTYSSSQDLLDSGYCNPGKNVRSGFTICNS